MSLSRVVLVAIICANFVQIATPIGGKSKIAQISKFPWMASFGIEWKGEWLHYCGGAVVSDHILITTAECGREANDFKVRFGSQKLNDDSAITYEIEKITPHPSYKGFGIKFNVAIVYTKSKITFSHRTMPISLPKIPNDDPYRYTNEEVKFSDWGYLDDRKIVSATFKVLPESECLSRHTYLRRRKSKDFFFCAGNANKLSWSCAGDMGGPLVRCVDYEDHSPNCFLIGILHGSKNNYTCSGKVPSIFIRLDNNEIRSFLIENGLQDDSCADGYFGYPKCNPCSCDSNSIPSTSCNKESGQCQCYTNFAGLQCDSCADWFHEYPHCYGPLETKEVSKDNCSAECGFGTQTVTLVECKIKYIHGIGQEICNWDSVKSQKIDCQADQLCRAKFGECEWTTWTECTLTCLKTLNERSIRTRTRECLDDENEEECQDGRSQSETCNEVELCSIEDGKLEDEKMTQRNVMIAACSVLVFLICCYLTWKYAIIPKMPSFYSNIICARCFFPDRENLEYDVYATDFVEMYDCHMNEERKIMEEVSGKLGNGHNNRRYKVATNKDMRPSYLIENELKRLADLSKRTIAIVTKGALESQHFLLTVQVLTSIERYQKLIVVLSEPNLLEQVQIRCEPLALHIKNHSCLVFEEKDFWENLHYKLPHKQMETMFPNHTGIELEPLTTST